MKHSIRRVFCMALALLFVLGLVEDLRLVPGGRIADESFLAISGLTDADAAAERSAHAEEADLEADSTPFPKPSEAAPQESTAPDGGPSANPAGSPDPSAAPSESPAPNPDEGAAPAEPSVEPSTEPSIGPSIEPSLDPSIEPAASNDPDEDNPEAPPSLLSADATQFSCGYAHIASGSTVCVSEASGATELATLSAGVVYVAEMDADGGPAKICFAHEGLAYAAWTDADNLTPLTADELDALRIPSDAPTYNGNLIPEPGAHFLLVLSIEACPELTIGDSFALVAAYSDGKDYSIQWSSSDPSVATVDGGTLTAVSPGEAIITASGVCAPASIRITVSEPASISLSAGSISIGLGETVTDALCCTVTPAALRDSLSWSSSNTRYVKVDKATGAITGLRTGSATVTVTAPGGLRASCKVTVRSAPRSVKLSAGTSVLGVGDSTSLTASFNSGAYSHGMLYAISDESIVRLEDGRLHAAAPGEATITVKTFNGKTASMRITVLPEPESVSFSSDAPILGVGQSYQLSAAVNPESVSAISYSGDKPEVAEVAPDGSITAIAVGSVNVTATAYNGVSSTQTITVVPAPTAMTLSASSVTLCVGERVDAPVAITLDSPITGGLSFKCSNTRYAKVDKTTGAVTGLRTGSVSITVTTYNGVTAKYTVKVVKAPTTISISGASLLGVGDSAALKVSANSGAGVGHYSLSSSDPAILTIDPDTNRVLGMAPGEATVTVKNFNGKTASMRITVLPEPESVSFSSDAPILGVGQRYQLSAAVNPESVSAIAYSGDKPEVAEVSPDGSVTAIAVGSVNVTATAYNGVSSTQTITVVPAPTAMTLSASSVTLCVGERVDAPVAITLDSPITGGLSFKCSNTRYAKVDKTTGAVTGLRTGSVSITVTTYNGVTAKYTVKVVKAPTTISISGASLLGVGDSAALKVSANSGAGVGHYSLSSSDPAILTIDPDTNRVLGMAPGEATVTVKNFNGKTASMRITVLPEPESVSFSSDAPILGVGQRYQLSAAVNPESVSAIAYSGDKPEVAVVSPDGSVTAIAVGSVNVTATAYNGVSSTQTITVVPAPTAITLSASSVTLCVGEKVVAPVAITLDSPITGGLSFKCSNTRYAKVDKTTGAVTGLRTGSVSITVTTYNGVTAKYTVKVVKAPTTISISGASLLGVGDSAALKVSANSGAGVGHYSLSSSDPAILTIDPDTNRVLGMAPGEATVTVKNFNGKTASMRITVLPEPESVSFSSDAPILGVGQSYQLSAAVNPESVSAISYSGDKPEVAEVAPDGSITAIAVGSVNVTATAYNGVSSTQTITVVPAPTAMTLSASSVTLCVGERVDAPVAITLDSPITGGLSFKCSNTRYAKVDKTTGAVTGLRTGSVSITVTTYNGVTAKYTVKVVKAPTTISISGASLLGVGDSAALKVSANSGAGVGHYSLSSSDPAILTIDPDTNRVLGMAPGEATVTVKNFNGKTASMRITVLPEPESVSFSSDAPILGVGQSYQLSAAVNPESVSAISYSGDKPEVAEVAPDGSITAIAVGSVNVTATAYNGASSTQTITVVPAPTKMTLENGAIYIGLGEVLGDALQIRFNEGSAASVRFKSSNTRYVKVNADGTLTGLRVGSATVTVTSHNGLTASCRVVVQQAPSKVALRLPISAFSVGQTQRAEVSVTGRGHWILTSSDPTVVAVEDGCVLHALQEGDVTITARTYNGKTASAKLHVLPAPEEVYPVVESASVAEGLQIQVEFYVNEGSCATFSYAVADPSLARVDESGCVTGLQSGHTQLTATTHNGLTASMELEILPGPDEILFDDEALTIGLGELRSFGFKALPEDAVGVYSYASSDPKIVRVSEDGQLAGISIGTAIITVTAQNGTSAELSVTVVPYSQVSDAINMAHRGASGYRPDNSIAAFEYAAELGADMVELDVRKTKDGVIVVIHDGTISYNGKKYDVASLTMKQLRIANPNICTLDEALTCIAATDMEVMIEFKVSGIEQDVLDLVGANGMDGRAKYGSFTLSVINRVKALQPSAETIYIISNADTLKKVVNNPQSYSASIISVSTAILKANDIYRLHLGGKQVVAWTINTRSEIQRFIEMGVDGITTNFPDYM